MFYQGHQPRQLCFIKAINLGNQKSPPWGLSRPMSALCWPYVGLCWPMTALCRPVLGFTQDSKDFEVLAPSPPRKKKKRPPTPTPPHTHGNTSSEINQTLLRFMRDLLNSNLTWPQGGPMPDPFASPDPPPVLWVMHPWGSCGLRGIHTSRGSPKAPWMDPQGSLGVLRDLRRLWRPREAKKARKRVFP